MFDKKVVKLALLLLGRSILSVVGECESIDLDPGQTDVELCPPGSFCFIGKELEGGKSIFPIGRSYNGNEWELYTGRSDIYTDFICDSDLGVTSNGVTPKSVSHSSGSSAYFVESYCSIELPELDQELSEGPYILSECEMKNVSKTDEFARFLDQVTFGVTMKDLTALDQSSDPMDVTMAKFVKSQMEDIEMTSHMAFFRKHALGNAYTVHETVRPKHVCEKHTKWARYAFHAQDKDKKCKVEKIGGKIILSIGGQLKTMADSINWYSESYRKSKGNLKTDGTVFDICSTPTNGIGKDLKFRNPDGRSCQHVTIDGLKGTPIVKIDESISLDYHVFDLSDSDVEPTSQEFRSHEEIEELLAITALTDPKCDEISLTDKAVFGKYNGAYYVHTPPFALEDNDMYSPALDGGGKSVRLSNGKTQCSNAPMTQVNEEHCILSYEEDACKPSNNVLEFELNDENIRTIYEGTVEYGSPRYVVAIDIKEINGDSWTGRPCQFRSENRWAVVDMSECDPELSTITSHTQSFLGKLIAESNDKNPYVKNIVTLNEGCAEGDRNKQAMAVAVNGTCYRHVHQDYLNVYDLTNWYKNYNNNKLKTDVEAGVTIFEYTDTPYYWRTKAIKSSDRFGRYGDIIPFTDLASRRTEVEPVKNALKKNIKKKPGVVVCGTPGEISNDPSIGGTLYYGAFDFTVPGTRTWDRRLENTRKTTQTMAAVYGSDQLRQKMAWALTSMLAISVHSTNDRMRETEKRAVFTDILVRNAFGSYRNILEEISFSSIMAQNLSFRDSKSTEYHWKNSGKVIQPDQNFAREILQLFSLGICLLNQDGSEMKQNGVCVPTYDGDDIFEYARVWTGFTRQARRGNLEQESTWNGNNNDVDPMTIRADWRDKFPKLGLNNYYIGDNYPLCVDRPEQHFLKKNAKYRLLGGSSTPLLQYDPPQWDMNDKAIHMSLSYGSQLYNLLCSSDSPGGDCNFQTVIVLDQDLECSGSECDVDTVRTVEVTPGIFYEYISAPCVEQAFFNDAKKLVSKDNKKVSCASARRSVASAACCACETNAARRESYWGERMTFNTAQARCESIEYTLCDFPTIKDCIAQSRWRRECLHNVLYWSSAPCEIKIKVNPNGKVALFYESDGEDPSLMDSTVNYDNPVYFPVLWGKDGYGNDSFPTPDDSCGNDPSCEIVDDLCVCSINVSENNVFDTLPSKDQVLSNLRIGSHSPSSLGLVSFDEEIAGVKAYFVDDTKEFNIDTVFEVRDNFGVSKLLKNVESTVNIGSTYSFRNPPHFLNLVDFEKRDAYYETDAALDQLFYHENLAPFLAKNIIQHFGNSNPSPTYIQDVATAFVNGKYSFESSSGEIIEYGSNSYGDLAALIACVILHSEARDVFLESDPTYGSVRAPLLKLFKLLRSMEATSGDLKRFIEFYVYEDVTKKLGQEAYEINSVFSYFYPDFKPSGRIDQADLVSPEAQLLTSQYIIPQMNAFFELIKTGMNRCNGNFFYNSDSCRSPGQFTKYGHLTYGPKSPNSDTVLKDLSTLLTGGRLSKENMEIIRSVYDSVEDKDSAFLMAQQLITTSPEFHTSGALVHKSGLPRLLPPRPLPSSEPYKAVVFVMFNGGMDSNNLLVPMCDDLKAQYLYKRDTVALNDNELIGIQATGQPCDNFAIHHKLPFLKELYEQEGLLFLANTGATDKVWDRYTYRNSKLKGIGAHNSMQNHVRKLDYASLAPGTGVMGRIADALSATTGTSGRPFQVGMTSTSGFSYSLVGKAGTDLAQTVVSSRGITKFNPSPWSKYVNGVDLNPYMLDLNNATTLSSSMYGETWSSKFVEALDSNAFLSSILSNVDTSTTYPTGGMNNNLKEVSRLIKVRKDRNVDRDLFYVNYGGWDHHSSVKNNQNTKFQHVNEAIKAFWNELKAQNMEDRVCLVVTSDFGRTMTPNSNEGSDHGWGGHYFMVGGDVRGKRIVGEFPDNLDGPYTKKNRGSLIPTTPWDSVWHGISQWLGVDDAIKLHQILPGRDLEIANEEFFTKDDLFKNNVNTQTSRRNLRQG